MIFTFDDRLVHVTDAYFDVLYSYQVHQLIRELVILFDRIESTPNKISLPLLLSKIESRVTSRNPEHRTRFYEIVSELESIPKML